MLKMTMLVIIAMVTFSCQSDAGKAIGAAACKTQCPVAHAAAMVGCEKLLVKKPELYPLCTSEADAVLLACPIACDLIKR
jgi:hypothetical protein